MDLNERSLLQYLVNAGVLQGSTVGPALFLLQVDGHLDDVICNIAIIVDDTTLYCNCHQAPYLWQQLELTFEV